MKIKDILNISEFNIEDLDISFLNDMNSKLPRDGKFDLNMAEIGLIYTLEAQNFCQDKISLLDRYIGTLETSRDKAWSEAALTKSKSDKDIKTAKDKEWFAQSDEEFITACNKLSLAKAAKKWFENKASYYSGWHYSFKTFLKRDYGIENSSNTPAMLSMIEESDVS